MSMHDAYTAAHKAIRWRGWTTVFFFALFVLPVVIAGLLPPVHAESFFLLRWAEVLFGLALLSLSCMIPVGALMALCLGAKALLKRLLKAQEPFNFFPVAAMLAAAALACADLFMVPALRQLLASFGADLPSATLIALEYHYLLLLPVLLLPFLAFRLRNHPRREFYFASILAGEFFVMAMGVVVLYLPLFKMHGEAVAA